MVERAISGNPVLITALDNKGGAEMATDEGAIYVTSNGAYRNQVLRRKM